jgi:hypothetical protein
LIFTFAPLFEIPKISFPKNDTGRLKESVQDVGITGEPLTGAIIRVEKMPTRAGDKVKATLDAPLKAITLLIVATLGWVGRFLFAFVEVFAIADEVAIVRSKEIARRIKLCLSIRVVLIFLNPSNQ